MYNLFRATLAVLPSATMGLNGPCEGGAMNLIKINMPEPFLLL